ncbi:MAG: hypothetical protein LBG80_19170 [Bacteroidales bacterium]|jgi:hypothetical protein|nr:hypothetical protein [Bacteroidales bacterium]
MKVKIIRGMNKALSQKFGCGIQTVSLALGGRLNSNLAKEIRYEAVRMGGDAIYEKMDNKREIKKIIKKK